MTFYFQLHQLPKPLKKIVWAFILVVSMGFFSGISFVEKTSNFNPKGIQENYMGNEQDENAETMKFKKEQKQMLNIIHSHILSMGVLFFLIGILVYGTSIPNGLKTFLMIEPLISVLLTFGGIYWMWSGVVWLKYVVMISGILMTLSFAMSIITIAFELLKTSKNG